LAERFQVFLVLEAQAVGLAGLFSQVELVELVELVGLVVMAEYSLMADY
jgi:hypothetical protein